MKSGIASFTVIILIGVVKYEIEYVRDKIMLLGKTHILKEMLASSMTKNKDLCSSYIENDYVQLT